MTDQQLEPEPQSTVMPYDFKLEESWGEGLFEFSFRHNCHFRDKGGIVHIAGAYSAITCLLAGTPGSLNGPKWTLVTAEPITIAPSIRCVNCGMHGFVKEGQWIPA